MARKFDLTKYETVKERKARFRKAHEDGRIAVKIVNPESAMEYALFEARVYKDAQDQEKDLPLGVGYALEVRDTKLSTSNSGMQYESVNYTSWTENCEESAVGRALDNGGFASSKDPSMEEMEKVGRMSATLTNVPQKAPSAPTEAPKNEFEARAKKIIDDGKDTPVTPSPKEEERKSPWSAKATGEVCPTCGEGEVMYISNSVTGSSFYGCSKHKETGCDFNRKG